MEDLKNIGNEYGKYELDIKKVSDNPIEQFKKWLDEAIATNALEPNSMILSTSTTDGKPSSRALLLKEILDDTFCFFTNYQSKKGKQISSNPYGSLLFFWPEFERQVTMEGELKLLSKEKSDEYFRTRPEKSKIGAWSSPQSTVIPNKKYIEIMQKEFEKRFVRIPVIRPPHWGGYQFIPNTIEFWQGRPNRLHDRILFTKNENGEWIKQLLAP
ncbi:pyridoxamine 5'-phosphate oxidase [Bacteroidota bacterium]